MLVVPNDIQKVDPNILGISKWGLGYDTALSDGDCVGDIALGGRIPFFNFDFVFYADQRAFQKRRVLPGKNNAITMANGKASVPISTFKDPLRKSLIPLP